MAIGQLCFDLFQLPLALVILLRLLSLILYIVNGLNLCIGRFFGFVRLTLIGFYLSICQLIECRECQILTLKQLLLCSFCGAAAEAASCSCFCNCERA